MCILLTGCTDHVARSVPFPDCIVSGFPPPVNGSVSRDDVAFRKGNGPEVLSVRTLASLHERKPHTFRQATVLFFGGVISPFITTRSPPVMSMIFSTGIPSKGMT